MFIHRSGDHKFILTKGNEMAVWLVEGISHQSQIHAAIQNSCYGTKTVGLPGVEIDVRDLAGKGTENVWQKIGRGNGGNGQVNDLFVLPGELFNNVAAHVQDIGSAVVELKPLLGDSQLLGGADQQARIQFLFQGNNVCADGGLSQIQLAGSFREAFIFDYGDEGF